MISDSNIIHFYEDIHSIEAIGILRNSFFCKTILEVIRIADKDKQYSADKVVDKMNYVEAIYSDQDDESHRIICILSEAIANMYVDKSHQTSSRQKAS